VTAVDKKLPEVCPKCGSKTLIGYGLAGGGVGVYVACDGDTDCDFFMKRQDEDETPSK
jgi:hypothetical protein